MYMYHVFRPDIFLSNAKAFELNLFGSNLELYNCGIVGRINREVSMICL